MVNIRPVHIHQQEEFHMLMLLLLHLIHLLCRMDKSEEQTLAVKRIVHRCVRMDAHGTGGKMLLHLAVDNKSSSVSDEFYSRLPELEVVELLVECGAPVNGIDAENNTPLHACAATLRGLLDEREVESMKNIVNSLIRLGAHVDAKNTQGRIAGEELARSSWFKICLLEHVTLKCLAARVVQNNAIPFEGEVPVSLIPFINMH